MLLLFSFAHAFESAAPAVPSPRPTVGVRMATKRTVANQGRRLSELLDVYTFPTLSRVWIVTSANDTNLGAATASYKSAVPVRRRYEIRTISCDSYPASTCVGRRLFDVPRGEWFDPCAARAGRSVVYFPLYYRTPRRRSAALRWDLRITHVKPFVAAVTTKRSQPK